MSEQVPLVIPRESVSDDVVLLGEWLVGDGQQVAAGQIVAHVETSKAIVEIAAPVSGFLRHGAVEGAELAVGEAIGSIAPSPIAQQEPREAPELVRGEKEARFSRRARALMEKHGIPPDAFAGLALVSEEDVRRLVFREEKLALPVSERSILVFGAGGHGKMCLDVLKRMPEFALYGIVDDDRSISIGEKILDIPVVGRGGDLDAFFRDGIRFIVNGVGAITNHGLREKLYRRMKETGFAVPTITHPNASVESSARIGAGSQIFAGAVVGSSAVTGENCIVNSSSVVSHDCVLGSNVHVAPGALLAGGVVVGDNTLIGMGCTIYLHVRIGRDVTIFNGANITKDVADGAVVR